MTRPRAGRTQSALLVLLLLITLVVTVVLTYQGRAAAKAHQVIFEEMLFQNAAFAAMTYAPDTEQRIYSIASWAFGTAKTPFNVARDRFPRVDLAAAGGERVAEGCQCDVAKQLLFNYAFDYRTRNLVADNSLGAAERARLQRLIDSPKRLPLWRGWEFAVLPGSHEGPIVMHAVRVSDDGEPIYAIGFAVTTALYPAFFAPVATFNLQLPPPRKDQPPAGDRYAIRVVAGQDTVFQGGTSGRFIAEAAIKPPLGGFKVFASVSPDAVPLVAGTSPRSRTPILVSLLVLAAILIASALILLKREGELAQARADFVSGVSHELRTPLAQIRMFTETLLLGRVRNDGERRRSLEIIDQEARRLTALVDNVLHLSRSERGVARVTPTETLIAPSIRETVGTFAQLPRSRNVEFRLELEDRLVASVDPGALHQIILNLLDNAVKYGPAGQRVSVGLAMFEHNARLWVDDEGPGIPVRERERVFEPFYRATHQSDSMVVGSGIGLAVVRELTALLRGRVWAEDAPGAGTRVVVEFPDAYLRAEEATGGWAVA